MNDRPTFKQTLICTCLITTGLLLAHPAPAQTYLGNTGSQYDADSVSNPYGTYGSKYSPKSINNPYGEYGSKYSNKSVNNPYATDAPKAYINGQYQGRVTANPYADPIPAAKLLDPNVKIDIYGDDQ